MGDITYPSARNKGEIPQLFNFRSGLTFVLRLQILLQATLQEVR